VDLLDGVAFSIMFCPLRRPDFRRSEAGRGQLYPSSSVCGAIGEEGGSLSGEETGSEGKDVRIMARIRLLLEICGMYLKIHCEVAKMARA